MQRVASTRALLALQRRGACTLAALSALALATLLPAYVSGANYYTCGDPLMHTSLAYLADAPSASVAQPLALLKSALRAAKPRS